MCELGSQGGMDGRWHCSAAQVEILLFQHADIRLFMLTHFLFSSLPVSLQSIIAHLCPSLCQHALLIDYEKMGTKREGQGEGELEGWRFLWHTSLFGASINFCASLM